MMSQSSANLEDVRMHSLMWETYFKAGQQALRLHQVDEARRMFNLAMERGKLAFDNDDLRQLQTIRWMVKSYIDTGEYQQAERLLEPLMHELFARFGGNSPEMLDALEMLVNVYEHQCKFTEASKLLKYILSTYTGPADDPHYADLLHRYNAMLAPQHEEEIRWLH